MCIRDSFRAPAEQQSRQRGTVSEHLWIGSDYFSSDNTCVCVPSVFRVLVTWQRGESPHRPLKDEIHSKFLSKSKAQFETCVRTHVPISKTLRASGLSQSEIHSNKQILF